jgi:uncharacterized protein YprB with RNaseH-like and TPR domain
MGLSEKFAHLAALRPLAKPTPPVPERDAVSDFNQFLTDRLGGQVRSNTYGEHLYLRQWYATPEECVPDARSLAFLISATPGAQAVPPAALDPRQWLFLDTETTGLSGGTGTYAFLIGIAWWDAGGLQVEQFFLRDLDEEHSVLLELAERMAQRPVLVTFNGKSFDWPLLETRYRLTRRIPYQSPEIHLDLLHPARRVWRLRLGSVRLQELERQVLSEGGRRLEWTREDDINSALIPQMYFDYLRGSPAGQLTGVIRHNQMDLRGLAALSGKLLALFDTGNGLPQSADHASMHSIDLFGVSRLLLRSGNSTRARELHESALRAGLPLSVEQLARKDLAKMAKREADYSRANAHWEELRQRSRRGQRVAELPADASLVMETAIEAAEQLAMYYEHRAKQPARALQLVASAIQELREHRLAPTMAAVRTKKLEERLALRLARLNRKCPEAIAATGDRGSRPGKRKSHARKPASVLFNAENSG